MLMVGFSDKHHALDRMEPNQVDSPKHSTTATYIHMDTAQNTAILL